MAGHCIPLSGGAQGLHLRTGDIVDEKLGSGGGLEREEEVVTFAGPGRAFFQFFWGEGGGDCSLQGGVVGLRQVY